MRTRRTIRYTPSDALLDYPVRPLWWEKWDALASEARLSRIAGRAPRHFLYQY